MIKMIMARALDGTIGDGGTLPWYLSTDLKRFKSLTMDQVIVMGRKTYDSLPAHKLPGRTKLVLTRDKNHSIVEDDFTRIYHDYRDILHISEHHLIWVIGGSSIYDLFLPYAHIIKMTEVQCEPDGDIKIPDPADSGDFIRVYFDYDDIVQNKNDDYGMLFYDYSRIHTLKRIYDEDSMH